MRLQRRFHRQLLLLARQRQIYVAIRHQSAGPIRSAGEVTLWPSIAVMTSPAFNPAFRPGILLTLARRTPDFTEIDGQVRAQLLRGDAGGRAASPARASTTSGKFRDISRADVRLPVRNHATGLVDHPAQCGLNQVPASGLMCISFFFPSRTTANIVAPTGVSATSRVR